MNVEVIRSNRRKRTVQARLERGVLRIFIPGHFDAAEEAYWVEKMTHKFEQQHQSDHIDLPERCATLATAYGLRTPDTVTWSTRQQTLWGSCTPSQKSIRISQRVAGFPPWVLDYVLVHELAHLTVRHHSPAFWDLVNRYPKAERARGYLMAKAED